MQPKHTYVMKLYYLLVFALLLLLTANVDARVDVLSRDGTVVCSCTNSTVVMLCNSGDIDELPDLSECNQMGVLELTDNHLADISPLLPLTGLVVLKLGNNQISDLSVLRGLSQLMVLEVGYNLVHDLSPLSSLTHLDTLSLTNNQISHLDPLTTLVQLQQLSLQHNKIASLGPLSGLTQLSELYVGYNNVSDVTPLTNLTRLTGLVLVNNHISQLRPLHRLEQLTTLNLANNRISQVDPLCTLVGLKLLDVSNNSIASLQPLSNLTQIEVLQSSYTLVSDLNFITGLTQLKRLNLTFTEVVELEPLSDLNQLTELSLQDNPHLERNSPHDLARLTNLTTLWLGGNFVIDDISPLSSLLKLERLSLFTNNITNAEPLSQLINLRVLDLSSNFLTTVSWCSSLPNLKFLALNQNLISEVEMLSNVTSLTDLQLANNGIAQSVDLSSLVLLTNLELQFNSITKLTLSHLTSLQSLDVQGNLLTEIDTVSSLRQLRKFAVGLNQLTDISPLSSLTTLTHLLLETNRITNLQPLSRLDNLELLGLENNNLEKLDSLAGLTKLTTLALSYNSVQDLTPLSKLTRLQTLEMAFNNIQQLDPITELSELSTLILTSNHIADLKPLSSLTALKELSLTANVIEQLEPLSSLTALQTLNLRDNLISNLKPLSSVPKLTVLTLSNNQIDNIDDLISLPLTTLDLHLNQIRAVSPSLRHMLSRLDTLFMEQNPSVCGRMLDPRTKDVHVVCDCAKGYYGTDTCSSIEEDFVELPGIISRRSKKCFDSVSLRTPFCPSQQVTDYDQTQSTENLFFGAQSPSLASFHLNTSNNTSAPAVVKLSWVESAFRVADPSSIGIYFPLPPLSVYAENGLHSPLHGYFNAIPNVHIPTFITYNVSQPLPSGISFTNGSTNTWFSGKPDSMSQDSIGLFNITVTATEHFTGQTKVAAHVTLNVTTCGTETCNGRGSCSTERRNPYRPVCHCNIGYNGTYCETKTDTKVEKDSSLAHWVAPVIVVIIVLLSGAITVYYWKSKRFKRLRVTAGLTEQLLSDRDEELQEIHSSWDIPWCDLAIGEEIGTGAFGAVAKAMWQGNEVAVKRMKSDHDFTSELFEKEVRSMTLLRHPNLVTFYGAGKDHQGLRFLVVEYLAYGSLREMLNDSMISLEWVRQMVICRDIALGMAFLHNRSPPVMHRDLKADNCFVSSSWNVKVGDFGSILRSKSLGTALPVSTTAISDFNSNNYDVTATFGCGTPLWMAPEVIATARHGEARYGLSADVYSYAIVMFEVATRSYPFGNMKEVAVQDLLSQVQEGLRPSIPSDLPEAFVHLMTQCWNSEHSLRPSFEDICTFYETNI